MITKILFDSMVLIYIGSLWKIFEKAGRKKWEGFIPVYNLYVWLKIIKKPWWWMLLMCIPYVGLVWSIWATNRMAKAFGKSEGFTVGLLLLGFVFWPILAWGDAEYDASLID